MLSSEQSPGACFRVYDLIFRQEGGYSLNMNATKTCQKASLQLLLATWSAELKLSALKKRMIENMLGNNASIPV